MTPARRVPHMRRRLSTPAFGGHPRANEIGDEVSYVYFAGPLILYFMKCYGAVFWKTSSPSLIAHRLPR